jgi:hypothetical protein
LIFIPSKRFLRGAESSATAACARPTSRPDVRPETGQKEGNMKITNLAKTVVLGLALLLATGAFASNKTSVHFDEAVDVNGQQLPAGNYNVHWTGSGSNVELSFLQGKKEVAKVSAKMIDLDSRSAEDAAVIDHTSGKAAVSQIRFAGKKSAISLTGSDQASMSH